MRTRCVAAWLSLSVVAVLAGCERGKPVSNPATSGADPMPTQPEAQPEAEPEGADAGSGFVQPEPGAGDEGSEPQPGDTSSDPMPGEGKLVVGEDPCTSDADCVPQQCCHATTCGSAANAEACGPDTACTMDCRADTMDCGGGCLCHEGKCAARLASM